MAEHYETMMATGPKVTIWNGTSEVPAKLFRWDGATETALNIEVT